MREINLHDLLLDDAITDIMDAIEECVALGETEIILIHGYAHGDIIKRWIWSPQLVAALQAINVKLVHRGLVPRNDGATHLRFGEIG